MSITPVNGHLLIEPLKHDSYIPSDKGTYEEIGIVIAVAPNLEWREGGHVVDTPVVAGDKVYFDGWLAAKFPKEDGSYYWLVEWKDVRAVEHGD